MGISASTAWYIEDWGSTLGTSGENGWVDGSNTFFSAGALKWIDGPSYIGQSATTLFGAGGNQLPKALLGYGSQLHYIDGTSTAFFTKITQNGVNNLWACVAGYQPTYLGLQIFLCKDTDTSTVTSLANMSFISHGTQFSNGTLTIWYGTNGTWYTALDCTGDGGSHCIGTLAYAASGYGTAVNMFPYISVQCLGGSLQLQKSYWQYTIGSMGAQSGSGTISETWASLKGTQGSYGWASINASYEPIFDSGYFWTINPWTSASIVGPTQHSEYFANTCSYTYDGQHIGQKAIGSQYHVIGSTDFSVKCQNWFRLATKGANLTGTKLWLSREQQGGTTHTFRLYESTGGASGSISILQSWLPVEYFDHAGGELDITYYATGTWIYRFLGTRERLPFVFSGTYTSGSTYLYGYTNCVAVGGQGGALLDYSWYSHNITTPETKGTGMIIGTTVFDWSEIPSNVEFSTSDGNNTYSLAPRLYGSGQDIPYGWDTNSKRVLTLNWSNTTLYGNTLSNLLIMLYFGTGSTTIKAPWGTYSVLFFGDASINHTVKNWATTGYTFVESMTLKFLEA